MLFIPLTGHRNPVITLHHVEIWPGYVTTIHAYKGHAPTQRYLRHPQDQGKPTPTPFADMVADTMMTANIKYLNVTSDL